METKITAKDLAVSRGTEILYFDINDVEVVEGFNGRKDMGDLETLKNQIIETGVQKPLVGRVVNGKMQITDGERRYRATLLAHSEGHTDILLPFLREGKTVSETDRVLNMLISNEGKPLNAIEKAETLKRLSGYGWSVAQISKKTGYNEITVRNLLDLGSASEKIKNSVTSERISMSTALTLMKQENGEELLDTALAQTQPVVEGKPVKTKISSTKVLQQETKKERLGLVTDFFENRPELNLVVAVLEYTEGKISYDRMIEKING